MKVPVVFHLTVSKLAVDLASCTFPLVKLSVPLARETLPCWDVSTELERSKFEFAAENDVSENATVLCCMVTLAAVAERMLLLRVYCELVTVILSSVNTL